MVTKLNLDIEKTFNQLAVLCGFPGESGSEEFFDVLVMATRKVDDQWSIVDESHAEGLCFNVNVLLANAITEVLSERERDGEAVN